MVFNELWNFNKNNFWVHSNMLVNQEQWQEATARFFLSLCRIIDWSFDNLVCVCVCVCVLHNKTASLCLYIP
jgi:hypothetical protein